jgi:hypothetical protein
MRVREAPNNLETHGHFGNYLAQLFARYLA